MNAHFMQTTPKLEEMYDKYKHHANNEYTLSQELEKMGWDDDLVCAFIVYVKWNMLPSCQVTIAQYQDAKETLRQYGYMQPVNLERKQKYVD